MRRFRSALLIAAVVAGCGSAASPSAIPTVRATPTFSPTDTPPTTPSPSPAPSHTTLDSKDHALDPGTYRLDLATAPTILSAEFPTLQVTVPRGWHSISGWIINRGGPAVATVAVQFWNVGQVFGHPCQWDGTLFQPGPTVDDLAEALADVPLRNATEPVDVTLGGYAGRYLEWSVPADFDFSDCDLDGTYHDFESWTGPSEDSDRYQQGPGQVDRLWILDVEGARLVIDAFFMPSTTAEERQELSDVVESIRFEP